MSTQTFRSTVPFYFRQKIESRSVYGRYNDGGVNECCIGLSGRSVLLLSSFIPVADHREIGKIVDLSTDAPMTDVGEKIGFTVFVFKLKSLHIASRRVRLILLFTVLGGQSAKDEFADRLLLLHESQRLLADDRWLLAGLPFLFLSLLVLLLLLLLLVEIVRLFSNVECFSSIDDSS